ncbi:mediator complex subunit [Saitozyma podzolica]|uniref:Mediator of RNA polymerase II transcription subunit 14 n=1 Tax=Saitozyma podzolica TaxID=1890683 RepID=A0A427YEA9_9TREE|nr:mediator complex subunit [Saitozyma podzolica]
MTARPPDPGQAVLPPPPPLPAEVVPGSAPALATDKPLAPGPASGPGVGLGPEPWFAFPIPSDADIEDELPPYFEEENVPLGQMLDRVVRKGYGDMRHLVTEVLPPLNPRQKPRHVIDYAKSTRQNVLKYLAILRWKAAVDTPASAAGPSGASQVGGANGASFPTPQTNGESNDTSPAAYVIAGKGKAKAMDSEDSKPVLRGKVTDTKRIQQFMEHQNRQHEEAIMHVKHAAKVVEGLRLRNPDLLTALSLLNLGTYPRLPSSLTEAFLPRTPLTNAAILDTLRRLNAHILYRLRCVDYLPPDLVVREIKDGRAYVSGAGPYGFRAELSLVGFGEGDEGRWWLTGVEWGWKSKEKGTDDPGGSGGANTKKFEGDERQQILDVANIEILPPRSVPEDRGDEIKGGAALVARRAVAGSRRGSVVLTPAETSSSRARTAEPEEHGQLKVDGPLVRLYNFLQHLSLSYQLEVLYSQALALAGGRRRGQLMVEIDRTKKVLRLKYWIRTRPQQAPQQSAAAVGKRQPSQAALGAPRPPLVGGILSVTLGEDLSPADHKTGLLAEIRDVGMVPSERELRLGLNVKWEIGEAGAGGGLKAGEVMDSTALRLDPNGLSIDDMITASTRIHAAHLTRSLAAPLLASPRIAIFPSSPPSLVESDSSARPVTLQVPLPSRTKSVSLLVGVSARAGLIEIEDEGAREGAASEERRMRVRMTMASVNEGRTRIADDVGRLMIAIVMDNLESQMRQLGWQPTRRLALRSQDLAKADLHPATSIFIPLPSSSLHYFVAKINPQGIAFELLKLARVQAESGIGTKLVVGDRTPMDLGKMRERRKGRVTKRRRVEEDRSDPSKTEKSQNQAGPAAHSQAVERLESRFEVDSRDLRNLYIFCNALVSQTIIEQQLKDRAIPYTLQYPPASGPGAPKSGSAVAGMVPTLAVNTIDLLKDPRAADVAMPRVYMQIQDWWKGGKCHVVTVVQLRHRPSVSEAGTSPAPAPGPRQSTAARAEGIDFDQASSVVKFSATDISRCVPAFLEQWERLSKVIVVAGEVSRLNKSDQFKDLRMLSFDLRTATFSYSPGFIASITYTPTSDSYLVTFTRTGSASGHSAMIAGVSPAAALTPRVALTPVTQMTPVAHMSGLTPAGMTPGMTPGSLVQTQESPHEVLAGLLSHRLNELVGTGRRKGTAGKEFILLLRSTLPLLLAIESIRAASTTDFPALVIRSVNQYRLIWDLDEKRYALDMTLLPGNESYLLSDGSEPVGGHVDPSCGALTRIPKFEGVVQSVWEGVRRDHIPLSEENEDIDAGGGGGGKKRKEKGKEAKVLAIKLDEGRSLGCEVGVVGSVLKAMSAGVEGVLGIGGNARAT